MRTFVLEFFTEKQSMPKSLTPRQEQTLRIIRNSILHRGSAPTLHEITKELGIESRGAASNILRTLILKGRIKRHRFKTRGITLVDPRTDKALDTGEPIGVPLVGQVAAGAPLLAEENIERYVCLDRFLTKGRNVFLLKVKGDSMINAGISDGDLVIVRKQSTADPGDIIVALLDDEATVKYFKPKGKEVHLVPANDRMYSIVVPISNIQIQGKVIGVYREVPQDGSPGVASRAR